MKEYCDGLFEQVKVVDRMVVTDVTEFGMIGADKFKDNPVSLIDPEAPDFMVLGMQFFSVKRRVEGIVLEQVCFGGGFSLDGGW